MRCPETLLGQVTRQPEQGQAVIELEPGRHLEVAVSDLQGFSRIWLIWWFHRHRDWRPKVLPPRGRSGRKGVLATRSPHRPNPIGISAVPLLRVEGLKLWIGAHDLVDGTPILDIKPYLPRYDSFPEESEGWLEELEFQDWQVELPAELEGHPLAARVRAILQEDPFPHRTRRTLRMPDGRLRLSLGRWRFFYRIQGQQVLVESAFFQA
ncbi:tRNA (N6-threonylcarbamoyladenosine(37)-N6)-methyltransferase TrmO [bacterium]|nr:tRNA (N6-threonylcarbamoyladenosine(37)-N6)-methyltransferase TrmO [bacterium]